MSFAYIFTIPNLILKRTKTLMINFKKFLLQLLELNHIFENPSKPSITLK